MRTIFTRWFTKCKSRLERRLDKKHDTMTFHPEFTASNIHYDVSDRDGAILQGGIGAIHLLARRIGLIRDIDEQLHVLKVHLPYHESDHVLNIAYNSLCNGSCLEDIELRRQDENFLKALGTNRLPDPTTAGDFCRRFQGPQIDRMIDILQRCASACLEGPTPELFRRCGHRHGRQSGCDDGCLQSRHGPGLRWNLGLSSVGADTGQYRRGAFAGEPTRQPALPRRSGAKCFEPSTPV